MAEIIKANGEVVPVEPKDGKTFKLKELQEIVGGYVQMLYLRPGNSDVMVMNEDGKLNGLPMNGKATKRAEACLFAGDYIVGDVLVCKLNQIE